MTDHYLPTPPRPKGRRKPSLLLVGLLTGALAWLGGCTTGVAIGVTGDAETTPVAATPAATKTVHAPTRTVTEEAQPAETETVTEAPVTKTVKPKPRRPKATIPGDGIFAVGKEVRPGTYKARPAPDGVGMCYAARMSTTSSAGIIDNELGQGQIIVTIHSSDKYFKTSGCTTWRRA